MIAIITADIINSRKLNSQELWMQPLKEFLNNTIGKSPEKWEIFRGDYFQVEIDNPEKALNIALRIKTLIKKIETNYTKRSSDIDVRIAIGIGTKDYVASRVSESNGQAYILSGEKFEKLKKEKINLSIQTPWIDFDKEMNLYLKLAAISMDKWSISSSEIIFMALENSNKTQSEIGFELGIEQNSVSGRWKRAHTDEIIEMEQMFREKIKKYLL